MEKLPKDTTRGNIAFTPPGVILENITPGGLVHRQRHIIMYLLNKRAALQAIAPAQSHETGHMIPF